MKNILDIIGNTPLIYLSKYSKKYNCNIFLKLEKYNLNYSSKDRAVKEMILKALKDNTISKDTTIIEPTSGNTGIAIASICAFLSLKCIIIMPENTDEEKVNIIKALNANVYLINKIDGIKGAIKKAKEIAKQTKNSYILNQFDNPSNLLAHYKNTGKEIYNECPSIDCFCATYGTGGTISGISKYLKEKRKNIKCICVTPLNKKHHIPGIYSNIIPENYHNDYIDEKIRIDDVETYNMVENIAKEEGVLLGMSSCCAICGALKYIKENKVKNVVILCPDGLERYLTNKNLFYLKNIDKNVIITDLNNMYNCLFDKSYFEEDVWLKYRITFKEFKKLKRYVLLDNKAFYKNDPAAESMEEIRNIYNTFYSVFAYRIAYILWQHNEKKIARIISEYIHEKYAIDIHPQVSIGYGFCIDHGVGVVIGQTSKVGNNVRIYQGVTLGAISLNKVNDTLRNKKRHPTIKNNVIIYEKTSILGGKTIIGNNVIIGSNLTIMNSIKDNTIVKTKKIHYELKENKYDIQ